MKIKALQQNARQLLEFRKGRVTLQDEQKKGAGLKSTPVIIQYPMKNHLETITGL